MIYIHTDVTSRQSVEDMVKRTVDTFGKLDAIVNNAGINIPRMLVDEGNQYELDETVWDKVMNVNLKGLYFCAQAAAKVMVHQGFGTIINMSSESGLEGSEGQSVYAASKNAVNSLTRSWAKELSKKGLRVVAVAPGILEATGLRSLSYETALAYTRGITVEELRAGYVKPGITPMGRSGKLTEVANVVAFLISDRSSYIDGVTINIAGGKVTATGGDCGAGIGGGTSAGGKNITIAGGKVTATGGKGAAGIGGGFYGDGNDISITDGKVTATGGDYGAGIGGGNHGEGKNITITDGEATAIGGLNGAGIGGGLQKNGEKITVSGDATLKIQGGPTDEWDGAGAGIGNGGSHNGDFSGSFTPVNGAETEPDTSNLTTGKIEYYAPGADMTKDEPTSTTFGSLVQPEPSSPGETGAPVEYRMQTSASEPVQGNGKSTGYKAPVQGHFYQVVGQDGKDMIFATAQKKDVLAIATDSDFAMLTGKMVDIEALRKQGVRRIIFATKRATSTFLLSELLEKRAYGETWSLIHDGENVAFTAVEKMMDISSILTRLQTKFKINATEQ